MPRSEFYKSVGHEVKDKGVGGACVGESVRETQLGDQSWGLEEQVEYGRRNRGSVGVVGRLAKGIDLDSVLSWPGPRIAS